MEEWERIAKTSEDIKYSVFIGCGKKKRSRGTRAETLYIGTYFKLCLALAKTITSEKDIYILSAKYGLIPLEKEIEPYEEKITSKNKEDRKKWVQSVGEQLKIFPQGKRVFICSQQYYKYFEGIKLLPKMGIGLQMQWMKGFLSFNKRRIGRCLL